MSIVYCMSIHFMIKLTKLFVVLSHSLILEFNSSVMVSRRKKLAQKSLKSHFPKQTILKNGFQNGFFR